MNRLNFVKNFKAYTLRMKDQRKQNVAILRTYLKKQRQVIIQNTRRKMIRGVFWVGLLSVSYFIGHKIYSQKLQVQQMQKKLTRLYPSIVSKIQTDGKNEVYYVVPEYDDQLSNIIEMCWKYHYKIIVNSDFMDPHMRNENINKFLTEVPQVIRDKCLIISLEKLKKVEIDSVNGNIRVESGTTCKQLNQTLVRQGFQPIFPEEIAQNLNQTVYNAVVNNYPTTKGSISNWIVNLDLISPQGHYFRSSNENNQYGSTPNLNTIFLGTGGIFGLPIRTNFRLQALSEKDELNKRFVIDSDDLNQNVLATRRMRDILTPNQNLLNLSILNTDNNKVEVIIKTRKGLQKVLNGLENKLRIEIPELKQSLPQNPSNQTYNKNFNIFFNTNQAGFQKFMIFRQQKSPLLKQSLPFTFSQNLLKVNCQDQNLLIEVISELCSESAVVVWCKDHKFMKEIKKITDQSEVGSELMKILVQIRQGIDHKKIYYTHNRYEEYFAKGSFRKLTEVFW